MNKRTQEFYDRIKASGDKGIDCSAHYKRAIYLLERGFVKIKFANLGCQTGSSLWPQDTILRLVANT